MDLPNLRERTAVKDPRSQLRIRIRSTHTS